MRRRCVRHVLSLFALAALLLVGLPASAEAAECDGAGGSGGAWTLLWERLAGWWSDAREAVSGLVPVWAEWWVNPGSPPPPSGGEGDPPPTGKPRGPTPTSGGDGDSGGGLDPQG